MRPVPLAFASALATAAVVVPFDGEASQRIPADGEPMPGSLVLDDVPGRETLVAVFSRDAVSAREIAALVGVSQEQWDQIGSRSFQNGAVIVVGVSFEKEAR